MTENQNKWRNMRKTRILTELGTTDFSPHRKEDFIEEMKDIRKEMKKLGLRK